MRHLYRLNDCGALYWVVAKNEPEAVRLALLEDLAMDESPVIDRKETAETAGDLKFRLDGEDDTCSMWLAYLIVRDHASTVLACSEWP